MRMYKAVIQPKPKCYMCSKTIPRTQDHTLRVVNVSPTGLNEKPFHWKCLSIFLDRNPILRDQDHAVRLIGDGR